MDAANSTKKTVLVAYSSKTICQMLSEILTNMGYSVLTAENGVKVLQVIFNMHVDCVIAHVELERISGYALCRIIKNTPFLKHIAVILSNTENKTQFHYWSQNSRADDFYTATLGSNENLKSSIEKSIRLCSNLPEEKSSVNKKDVFEILTQAFDRELFNLYLKDNAYSTASLLSDIPMLIDRMAKNLTGILDYDIAAFIVNTEPLTERYVIRSAIEENDMEDFKKICRSDFQAQVTNRKDFIWQEADSETSNQTFEDDEKHHIKCYQSFPSDREKKYSITIHVASFTEESFSQRIISRLNYFADTYSILIESAIFLNNTIKAETKMRNSFSRFLPNKVINDIITNKESAARASVGENRKVAVLLADIRSFTSISEINPPETVVSFLNYFFEQMGAIIKKHGGTIDKFMGDAIMALFGAPDSYQDNGLRAANAALEMRNALIDTSMIKLPANYKFDFGIGIHYGSMIVGTIGSSEKKDYTVIGDNVNLASRVEGLTKVFGSHIIITEDVKKDIDSFSGSQSLENTDDCNIPHSTRFLGSVKVKGKNKPVRIFEISSDTNKYEEDFTDCYSKGLDRYMDMDFEGAIEYFNKALLLRPEDKATKYCIEECNKYLQQQKLENWDGSFKLLEK